MRHFDAILDEIMEIVQFLSKSGKNSLEEK